MVTPKVLSWLSMILLVIVGCKKGETNTADSRPQNAASSTSPVKSDAEAIVGKWIPVSGSNVAKPLTERDRELHEIWSFQDGQLSVNGQLVGQYTLLIDETPRRIVLSFGAGLRNDTYMIYELSGDRLKIAVGPEHSTSNFAPSPDTKVTIFRRDFTAATSIPANGVPSAGLAIVSSEVGSAATALASAQIPMSVPSLAVSASDNLDEWLQVAHGNAAAMPAAWFAHLEIAKAETRAGRREAAQQTLRLALEAFKPMEAPQRSFEAEGNYVAIANAQSSAGDRAGARATLSLAAGAHSRELSEGGHDFGQDDFAAAQANAGDFDGAEQTLCGLNGIEKSLASTKIVEAMAKEGNVTRALQIAVNARDPIRCRTVIVHALAESGNEQGLEEVLGASSTKEERANLQLQYLAHSDGAGLKDGIQAGVARALASLGNDALARRSVASELAFVYAKAGDFALASGEADQLQTEIDREVANARKRRKRHAAA